MKMPPPSVGGHLVHEDSCEHKSKGDAIGGASAKKRRR
jgi:hypothetical protein